MAPRTFASRLEKLQAALAAQLSKPIASKFLAFDPDATVEDYETAREQELDKMVEEGDITPLQRPRVLFMRWMTAEENADRVQQQLDGPVPELRGREDRQSPVDVAAPTMLHHAGYTATIKRGVFKELVAANRR